MNTTHKTLPIATFTAAIAAFALLPVSAVAAVAAITVTGVLTILAADYGRSERPLRAAGELVPLSLTRAQPVEYRNAA
jgi:uncharacterized protein (DUF697 family)